MCLFPNSQEHVYELSVINLAKRVYKWTKLLLQIEQEKIWMNMKDYLL